MPAVGLGWSERPLWVALRRFTEIERSANISSWHVSAALANGEPVRLLG